jgi:hypothetical protein
MLANLEAQVLNFELLNQFHICNISVLLQILMNAKRSFPASARTATVRTHGEAMSVAVVVTICYT